ncbi:MAG: hypothetical protein JNL72_05705 [Flavipsychrobacter sp.]|nr:hypothetical protein [Flavipsychrobacter sp.]
MAYLGTEKLKHLIKNEGVIHPFDPKRVVCGAYELSLGSEVFRTDSKDKKKEFLTQAHEQITINPGQFALLLTKEILHIPTHKIAFISIKAKIKLKGLVNVSGFHVDPGFKGNLVFSVYNAGSSPISLFEGDACFLIWFAELELAANEATSYNNGNHEHKNQTTIPSTYIDALLAGELTSPVVLNKKLDDNHTEIERRIGLIEKEQTAKDYLVKTALGLGIVILVKFLFDWGTYNNGYKNAIELKEKELKLDSTINQRLIEKRSLTVQIDSLTKVKRKLEDSK